LSHARTSLEVTIDTTRIKSLKTTSHSNKILAI